MKKMGILIVMIISGIQSLIAQNIGISEDSLITPESSSIMELRSTSKGILIPRMTRADRVAIASPSNGLLVYQTDNSNGDAPGFWYYSTLDSQWHLITGGGGPSTNDWALTGNASTDPLTNFLGTTDNQPLLIKTNNSEVARFLSDGKLGISTDTPTEALDVEGNIVLSNSGTASKVMLREPSGSGTNYSAFVAGAQTTDITYVLPLAQGAAHTVFENDGSGNLQWTDTVHASKVFLKEPPASGTNYISIVAPALASDITYTFPASQGAAHTIFTNDGSGNLYWADSTRVSKAYFMEPVASGNNFTKIYAGAQTVDLSYRLPIIEGTAYSYLENDGNGNLRWTDTIRMKAVVYSSPVDYFCNNASQTLDVTSTYYRITSTQNPNSRILHLSDGFEPGIILYINCVTGDASGFRMQAGDANLKLDTGTNLDFNYNDSAMFIWSGYYWVLMNYSDNS